MGARVAPFPTATHTQARGGYPECAWAMRAGRGACRVVMWEMTALISASRELA